MTNKKNILILILIFLTSCGYKPIFSTSNSAVSINNIEFIQESKLNNKFKRQINVYKNSEADKFYDLEIKIDQKKTISLKDSKGDPKIFLSEIIIQINVIENGKIITSEDFVESFSYNNNANKFDLSRYERSIEDNMVNELIEKIIIYLQTL